jgi:hypothetical protein
MHSHCNKKLSIQISERYLRVDYLVLINAFDIAVIVGDQLAKKERRRDERCSCFADCDQTAGGHLYSQTIQGPHCRSGSTLV